MIFSPFLGGGHSDQGAGVYDKNYILKPGDSSFTLGAERFCCQAGFKAWRTFERRLQIQENKSPPPPPIPGYSQFDDIEIILGEPKEYQDDTIFISGLPPDATVEDIDNTFGSIGIIKVWNAA